MAQTTPPPNGLLYVSNKATLKRLGRGAKAAINAAIAPSRLIDVADLHAARSAYYDPDAEDPANGGIVLIGSYDTLPAQRKDAIELLPVEPIDPQYIDDVGTDFDVSAAEGWDGDGFKVWSDDSYGDVDGDGIPELPVSRIPCCKDRGVVLKALTASGAHPPRSLKGFRDPKTVLADKIYQEIAGLSAGIAFDPMCVPNGYPGVSVECVSSDPAGLVYECLRGDDLYLVLHGGSGGDTSNPASLEFVASNDGGEPFPVVTTGILRAQRNQYASGKRRWEPFGTTVFAACCYSGLVAQTRANDTSYNEPALADCIAMELLELGIVALIGFTGTLQFPVDADQHLFSSPLHRLFWKHYRISYPHSPARALFEAKIDYIKANPDFADLAGQSSDFMRFAEAVALKTFWSATCIGKGWHTISE